MEAGLAMRGLGGRTVTGPSFGGSEAERVIKRGNRFCKMHAKWLGVVGGKEHTKSSARAVRVGQDVRIEAAWWGARRMSIAVGMEGRDGTFSTCCPSGTRARVIGQGKRARMVSHGGGLNGYREVKVDEETVSMRM